ncbi:MAG TPA: response regulator transcription factor [Burkholderiales bacterium]|nr:response regulator transcription factor [Burkholderiales bacterium]
MRVLVIEDEPQLRRQVVARLAEEGFQVDATGDGKEGLYFATEYPIDAAIVDLGLPGLPGLDLIRAVRARGSTLPVLVLTARGRWQDKVEGLEAGADDYLAKPFEMAELIARVKALLRRAAGAAANAVRCGPIAIDLAAQRVTAQGRSVELTGYEYRLLEYLVRHRRRIVSKTELADYLYAHDADRDSNVLEVLVGRLRRKLDPDGVLLPIETLRGRGYRFAIAEDAS